MPRAGRRRARPATPPAQRPVSPPPALARGLQSPQRLGAAIANAGLAAWRTTTFRLALGLSVLFAGFATISTVYLYNETLWAAKREAQAGLAHEYDELSRYHTQGGLQAVNRALFERSAGASPGYFYLLLDAEGARLSGDLSQAPRAAPASGAAWIQFPIISPRADGKIGFARRTALGLIGRQSDGATILVARDIEDAVETARRIRRGITAAAVTGVVLALLGGAWASREAARKVRALARLSAEVMGGDLTRRAPEWRGDGEYATLARALNAMLARLERLVHAARQASDAVAHDLRTPLARVRNRLESAADALQDRTALDGASLRANAAIEAALSETDRMMNIFGAVLRLSQIETGERGALKRLALGPLVRELGEFFEPVAEEAGLTLEIHAEDDLCVLADAAMISQALTNLLDNAIKYTEPGGRIRLAARGAPLGGVELSVADSGPGIAPADRARALQRFVRLDPARSQAGSGLGLSLVAAIAEAHNGRLELADGLGEAAHPGLRASLFLPRA